MVQFLSEKALESGFLKGVGVRRTPFRYKRVGNTLVTKVLNGQLQKIWETGKVTSIAVLAILLLSASFLCHLVWTLTLVLLMYRPTCV